MIVIFETIGNTRFLVNVGHSGTLQEMKEKVEQVLQIPIADQILYFNGNILYRDEDLVGVRLGSVIKFRNAGDTTPEPQPETMRLQLRVPTNDIIIVETRGGEVVQELIEKIKRRVGGTPTDQIFITTDNGMEIPYYRMVRDYAISFQSGVTVTFLRNQTPWTGRLSTARVQNLPLASPSPLSPRRSRETSPARRSRSRSRSRSPSRATGSNISPAKSRLSVMSSEKMRLVVLYRGLRTEVEVGRSDMVRELRARLKEEKFKIHRDREFRFTHKKAVLAEDRSFASQNLANGDIIDIEFTTGLARE